MPFLLILTFLGLCLLGCEQKGPPTLLSNAQTEATTDVDGIPIQLHDLYLELQRTYSRQFDRNGYSIQFAAVKPNTIVIRLEYIPGSPEQVLAFKVLEGAKTFVSELAAKKYGLPELKIDTQLVARSK